ncbi:hypothetical protein WICPIJ_009034 [Wickerhamomyces pijperi]|uniref:Uncharacterized protein n=1 Tax=Wickerhamomyces pijperi TaxID=599730 RepID=A0A9P8TFY2_WICPI|nr:hypothetical protein WICPIJ_009034 [Wickerhamomyces pijperi]
MSEIEASTTLLNRVDGSAKLQIKSTQIICSVTGPIEPKSRQELPSTSSLSVIVRPDVGVTSTREKNLEEKIRVILNQAIAGELYPRQNIQVTLQILGAGESKNYTVKELTGMVNCSYLALIDAGVALRFSFGAQCFTIGHDDVLVVDPTGEDLKISKSSHVVVYDVKEGKVDQLLYADSLGSFTEEQVYEVLGKAIKEVEGIHAKFREIIQTKVEKDYVWQF